MLQRLNAFCLLQLSSCFVFSLCCSIFCYGCVFAFVVLGLVFCTKPRDWLGRTVERLPSDPILYWVGRKTLTQSVDQARIDYSER